jgi:transposase
LVELYVKEGHNVVETAAILEVSTEYVRKRLHEAGLIKRPGTFTPHVPWEPDQLRLCVPPSSTKPAWSMKAVGEELGVSVGTVRVALHEAGIPVRRGGFTSQSELTPATNSRRG